MNKLSVLKEFWQFLMENKKWWLLPMVIFLALFSLLVVFTSNSTVTPFIYALF